MVTLSRRSLFRIGAATGVAPLVPVWFPGRAGAQLVVGGSLDPHGIAKYVTPLVIPPQMPRTSRGQVDYYEIAVRQFVQQILPQGMPSTTVWSYGSVNHPGRSTTRPSPSRRTSTGRSGSSGSTVFSTPGGASCRTCSRSTPPCTGPTHRAGPTAGTCGRSSPARRRRTTARFRSSPTSTATARSTTATASPRRGTCRMPRTFRPASRQRAPSTTSSGARRRWVALGAWATRSSSIRTASGPRRCGTTTTPSA
jgi:hypothetical protein